MSNEIPRDADFFVVEDTPFHFENLLKALKELGFEGEVIHVSSVSQGLKMIDLMEKSDSNIDIVISDLHLPDGIGLEILQKLRSTKLLAGKPFLVMSTESQQDIIISAFEAGATNYIVKPYTTKDLLEKLQFCWDRRVQEKERGGLFSKFFK